FARLARLRFLVSDAMCKPVLRRDRLDFGYDNRFQNPTICSRRLPCSPPPSRRYRRTLAAKARV
ncbi:hypothetical protein CC202_13740, partial [Pseudomonas savastanoi]